MTAVPPPDAPPDEPARRPHPPGTLRGAPEDVRSRLAREVPLPAGVVERLRSVCGDVDTSIERLVAGGRDWWPISVAWAAGGAVAALPAVVVAPRTVAEVSAVLAVCHDARVPVTPAAGRSGVCGGAVPVFGGVSLELTALAGVVAIDEPDLTVDVAAGTWGDDAERAVRAEGLTIGHWPQSIAISTVGGWVACRGAGQHSTRYGKIEDIVGGVEVVLADGRVLRTGAGAPRAALGPDLTGLFVGSEGTLGVITEVRLRVHPAPPAQRRGAWGFDGFATGLDACRRILRRGATPAVLRLYDRTESARHFDTSDAEVLIVADEGDPALIDATMDVVTDECAGARRLDADLVGRWLEHRNEVASLESLVAAGIVADTVEVAASWRALASIHVDALDGLRRLGPTIAASCHQSHAYRDGGCLYFTFAGRPDGGPEGAEGYYRAAWDAVIGVTHRHGGAISHHHGIGLNRARFMADARGQGLGVLADVKAALDPHGILNPGKLGLHSPWHTGPSDPWTAAPPRAASGGGRR